MNVLLFKRNHGFIESPEANSKMVFSSETTVLSYDLEIQLYIHRDLLGTRHRAHIREENSLIDSGKTMAKTDRDRQDRQLTQEKA